MSPTLDVVPEEYTKDIRRRVYKYATGDRIPKGSTYLCSLTETVTTNSQSGKLSSTQNQYVWHYFLVAEDQV